jgi:hypothetical protein
MLETLLQARIQMTRALELLDSASAPSQIGCHLDHAIQQLSQAIEAHRDSELKLRVWPRSGRAGLEARPSDPPNR